MSGLFAVYSLEEIKEIVAGCKKLALDSRGYLSLIVKYLTRVLNDDSWRPAMEDENGEAMNEIRTIFDAYKTVAKCGLITEEASKIFVERLELVLGSVDAQSFQVKNEADDDVIFLEEVPPATTTTVPESPASSFSQPMDIAQQQGEAFSSLNQEQDLESTPSDVPSTLPNAELNTEEATHTPPIEVITTSAEMGAGDQGHGTGNFSHPPTAEAVSSPTVIAACDQAIDDYINAAPITTNSAEMMRLAKDLIRREVEATLQKSGSSYTVTSKGPYVCHICNTNECSTLDSLATHIWKVHTKEFPTFICPYPLCESISKAPRSFTSHVKTCNKNGQTRTPRRQPAPRSSSANLEVKKSAKQSKGKSTKVPNPSKESNDVEGCSSQSVLNRETATPAPATPKSFTCKYCQQSFSFRSSLSRHELIHTGEKSYTCQHCQKVFNRLGNLRTHELIHTGEKRFECQVCRKKYTQKGHLTQHAKKCVQGLPTSLES